MASISKFYNEDGTIVAIIDDVLDIIELFGLIGWLTELNYRGEGCYKTITLDRKQLWFHEELKPFCSRWKKPHERWEPNEYTHILKQIQNRIVEVVKAFSESQGFKWDLDGHNSCLINKYENGTQHIPPHKDTHLSFGEEPIIIGFSVGQKRKLILENETKKIEFELNNNSIFIMAGRSQLDFKHSIPPEPELENVRYSLTIRHHDTF
jgi:alkylated DNA repair dioxygenase AlkB